jgi:hypothetical protein
VDVKNANNVKWHTASRGEGGVGRVGEVVIDHFGVHNIQPQSLRSQLVKTSSLYHICSNVFFFFFLFNHFQLLIMK